LNEHRGKLTGWPADDDRTPSLIYLGRERIGGQLWRRTSYRPTPSRRPGWVGADVSSEPQMIKRLIYEGENAPEVLEVGLFCSQERKRK
jgi:hypothetical protein